MVPLVFEGSLNGDIFREYIAKCLAPTLKEGDIVMVSVIRQQLMNYINIYAFLEDPEGCWKKVLAKNKVKYENSLWGF